MLSAAFVVPAARAQDVVDWSRANREIREHLINLINIKTARPDPNEVEAARYVTRVLAAEKIPFDTFWPESGRASVVARLKGDGLGG